jgi:hypothetical protein
VARAPASDGRDPRVWTLGWPFLVVTAWVLAGLAYSFWIDGWLFGAGGIRAWICARSLAERRPEVPA